MLNHIWLALILIGVTTAALLGRMGNMVDGMLKQAKGAVLDIALPLAGIMMLFLGMMRLAEKAGLVSALSRFLRPIFGRLFPDVPKDHPAIGAIVMNMVANLLGLGNAATPLGLKAMAHLDELNPNKGTATNAMVTFLAINTSAITLIPATAIGMLSARGLPNPFHIVGTTLVAASCAMATGILVSRLLQGLPMFRITSPALPGAAVDPVSVDSPTLPQEPTLRPLGRARLAAVLALVLAFAGILVCEALPGVRTSLQQTLGLEQIAADLSERDKAPPTGAVPAVANAGAEEKPGGFITLAKSWLDAVSVLGIPFMLVFFAVAAASRGVPVYEEFVEGAKEGWQVVVRIMPYLVAMLVALATVRFSGALAILQKLLTPVLSLIHFPAELLPMALMRPLSGSGSSGVMAEILSDPSVAGWMKYAAATMYGSTETTFYVLAVYFGSVAVRRTRHAVVVGLCADAVGLLVAVWMARLFFA